MGETIDPIVLYGHLPQNALFALLEERDLEIIKQRTQIQVLTQEIEDLKKENNELQTNSLKLPREDR